MKPVCGVNNRTPINSDFHELFKGSSCTQTDVCILDQVPEYVCCKEHKLDYTVTVWLMELMWLVPKIVDPGGLEMKFFSKFRRISHSCTISTLQFDCGSG